MYFGYWIAAPIVVVVIIITAIAFHAIRRRRYMTTEVIAGEYITKGEPS